MQKIITISVFLMLFSIAESFGQAEKQVVKIARITIDPAQTGNYKAAVKEIGGNLFAD